MSTVSTDQIKMEPIKSPKKKKKSYKQIMKDILKPKKKKEPSLSDIGGGEFSKVLQI